MRPRSTSESGLTQGSGVVFAGELLALVAGGSSEAVIVFCNNHDSCRCVDDVSYSSPLSRHSA